MQHSEGEFAARTEPATRLFTNGGRASKSCSGKTKTSCSGGSSDKTAATAIKSRGASEIPASENQRFSHGQPVRRARKSVEPSARRDLEISRNPASVIHARY